MDSYRNLITTTPGGSGAVFSCVRLALLGFFLFIFFARWNIGLADNGDFSRYMSWYVTKPAGFSENWPSTADPEWKRRFFHYYLPYWEIGAPRPLWHFSAAPLLLAPGFLLNTLFWSPSHLSLPIATLPLRFALFLLFFRLLKKETSQFSKFRTIPALLTAILALLMFADDAYASYINTFFREFPAFFSLIFLTFSIGLAVCFRNIIWTIVSLSIFLFLVAVRMNHIFIIALVLLILLPTIKTNLRPIFFLMAAMLTVGVGVVVWHLQNPAMRGIYQYSALFYGALSTSANPAKHLLQFGFDSGEQCINRLYDDVFENDCKPKFINKVHYYHALRVYLSEPKAFLRSLQLARETLRDFRPPYPMLPESFPQNVRWSSLFSLWTRLTNHFFVTATTVVMIVSLYLLLFFLAKKTRTPHLVTAAKLGYFLLGVSAVEVVSTLLTNGVPDLLRTLFLGRAAFDLATLCAAYALSGLLMFRLFPPAPKKGFVGGPVHRW
jgi:hypothetical protein